MKRFFIAALLAFVAFPVGALAQSLPIVTGTGQTYPATYPDQLAEPGTITTPSTVVVIPGVAGQRIFAFYLSVEATTAQVVPTQLWEWSTSPTCASGNTAILPVPIAGPTTVLFFTNYYSGNQVTNGAAGFIPAAAPLISPIGATLCIVVAGTTLFSSPIALYAQHQ